MAVFKHKIAPDFSDGVDRKELKQLRDRFLSINQSRLERSHAAMSHRQRDILDILPLLYHVNHPLLPGYVSQEVPRGVSNYLPSKSTLAIARAYSQTFRFSADKRQKANIYSLYMMGSSGTLAHSESSDVDLWLCHNPSLSSTDLALLQKKAESLDAWANSHGLELHTFLMDAEAFREGQSAPEMDSESSGSAQHYLLLDEFYRTAILLAGRYPLWWLIPPKLESNYASHAEMLLHKRFIKASDVVDFGCAFDIPKNELVGAGLWQLYKSLDSPYKSVLKLMLAEVYAQELPEQASLSTDFKQAVYDDQLSLDELDPYVLIYRRLERYLSQRGEAKRLELVRKSFYLKANKKLSKLKSGEPKSWQAELLLGLLEDWHWSAYQLQLLDERAAWKVDQVMIERQELLAELTHSYRFLSHYARTQGISSSITTADLSLLGRKLYATFQRKAGKVDKVNPGIAPSIWEENLALHHGSSHSFQSDTNAWLLYRDLASSDDASFHQSLRKSASLIELLAWLFFNGIVNSSTRLSLVPGTSFVTVHEVRSIIRALEQRIPTPLPAVPQEQFMSPAYIQTIVLFVNVGLDPMATMSERGIHRLSDRTDSLGYSSQRYNLVKTIDQVVLNSWHELSAHRYEKGDTLMQSLQAYLQVCEQQVGQQASKLSVYCYTSQRAEAIAKRVQQVFNDVRKAFFSGLRVNTLRYVLEVEEYYYLLQRSHDEFRVQRLLSEEELDLALSASEHEHSQIVLDRFALQGEHMLQAVLKHNKAGVIQIFYLMDTSNIRACALDEGGSLLRYSAPLEDERHFQSAILNFLSTVIERRQLSYSLLISEALPKIEVYKVRRSKAELPNSVQQVRVAANLEQQDLVVTAFYEGQILRFDLSFDGRDFSYAEHGDQQFQAIAHYVKQSPEKEPRAPLQIADISYPGNPMMMRSMPEHAHSTLDYLRLYFEIGAQLKALLD